MDEFDNKIEFLSGEFSYKFDNEKYLLTLFTNQDKVLINIEKNNFRKIYDLKNIILHSKEGRYKWYIEKCIHCFANEITFKVKFLIKCFSEEAKYTKIVLTSEIIKQIFHPAKFFYQNIEKAQRDILYNKIILKEVCFNIDEVKYTARLFIGDLLERGICSKFLDFVKLEIETDIEIDLEKIINTLNSLKETFCIIGLTKTFSLENIDLYNDKKVVSIIEEPKISIRSWVPNINLYFNDIFIKILKASMQDKNIEYRFFENNNSEINFFFLCRAFEQNFKIRFTNYKPKKRTKIENEIINSLLDILESKEENDFIKGLKNTLNKYRNKFFDQLLFTFENYENYFVEAKNYCFAKDSIKYLKYSDLVNMKDDGFENSARRISELRNKMAHEDLNVNFSMIDKFWINAFGYIVYIMILENIGLIKEEIFELLEDIHISMID